MDTAAKSGVLPTYPPSGGLSSISGLYQPTGPPRGSPAGSEHRAAGRTSPGPRPATAAAPSRLDGRFRNPARDRSVGRARAAGAVATSTACRDTRGSPGSLRVGESRRGCAWRRRTRGTRAHRSQRPVLPPGSSTYRHVCLRRPPVRAAKIYGHLRDLATKPGEKPGLDSMAAGSIPAASTIAAN